MAYVDPAQLSQGEARMQEKWNQDVVNNTIFLYSPPYAQMRTTGLTPGLIGGQQNAITFNTYDHNTDSMISTTKPTASFMTIQTAGVYLVTASLVVEGSSGGTLGAGYWRMWLQHGSGFAFASNAFQTLVTITNMPLGVSGLMKCAVGDTIAPLLFFASGNMRIKDDTAWMSAQWVSAGETTP